ncbi:Uncharacterized protein PCOAH_00037070 [Plasmodium coatneyi]|uniref:Pv-fam-d protein n=1 Tax=Plasmodium coatneyi TaxID=208452 RepID=A0A1B1E2B8_9APIC|nr:Uncharacterized protein PCOAH_00037070 [Plasmodium coatneyi]ANQ09192.1 Uncharacterized protein PCOAH_00037070 [Plasmodium coatneyi]
MKANNMKSLIFVKVATIILLGCTNQTCNDSDTHGRSLVKNSSANGEFDLRAQRLLGASGSWQGSHLVESFYDDGELFDYDSDHRSRRDVRDRYHGHHRSHRLKHGHSSRHHTSRRTREGKNNEEDEVLSLSQFYVDDDDDEEEEEEDDKYDSAASSSGYKSNDYDDVIDLTNAWIPNSKYRVSSMDVGLHAPYGDDLIIRRGQGSGGMHRRADGYCENKMFDGLSAMDTYKGYYGKEKRIMKRRSSGKTTKVIGFLGAVALSHHLISFFLATSTIVTLPLAASACLLGGLFYKKNKGKNKYKRAHAKMLTY